MPLYRYVINESTPSESLRSIDLPDIDAARKNAVSFAGAMLAEIDGAFWEDSEWRLDVADEGGLILCSIVVLGVTSAAGQRSQPREN
jgi:hypothetical protein